MQKLALGSLSPDDSVFGRLQVSVAFGAKALARLLEGGAGFTQSRTRLVKLFGHPLNSGTRTDELSIRLLLLGKSLTELVPKRLHAIRFLENSWRQALLV
jgi:hypothetical protein